MIAPDLTGARWRKSSRSGGGQNCVEVARATTWAAIRDTKSREVGMLTFAAEPFGTFVTSIKAGLLEPR